MAPRDLAAKARQRSKLLNPPRLPRAHQPPVLPRSQDSLVILVFECLKVDAPLGMSVAKSEAQKTNRQTLCVDLFVVEPAAKQITASSRGAAGQEQSTDSPPCYTETC